MCCSVLQCVAVCCNIVTYTRKDSSGNISCSVLQCVATCCSVLQCVAVCCSVTYSREYSSGNIGRVYNCAKHCNTLQHTATYCRIATHCNTLQHTATHCNTLQHTATQYSVYSNHTPVTPQLHLTYIQVNTLLHTATRCNKRQRLPAWYGVASSSRLLKILCLFCRIWSLL